MLAPAQQTSPPPLFLLSGRDPLLTSGGGESYVTAYARGCVLAGYRPHIFSLGPRTEVVHADFGVVYRYRSPLPTRSITAMLHRPWFLGPAAREIERIAAGQSRPTVIHSFSTWSMLAAPLAARLRRRGLTVTALATMYTATAHESRSKLSSPVIRHSTMRLAQHVVEDQWTHRIVTPLEGRALRRMRWVLVNYANVGRQLDAYYGPGLPVRRLTYSPPTAFADTELPRPIPAHGAAPLIVSVSRHDGRKGLETLIAALARLRDDGVSFRACLVGPGILLHAHRRLVRRLELDRQVSLPGRVPSAMSYLRRADVYVLPSRQEGSGSVALLEAMQAGVAAVVSDVDGLPEDVTDGHDALLVPAGDADAFAGAIRRLLDEPALRERLGANARATFEERFAAPVFVRELRALYTELGLPAA